MFAFFKALPSLAKAAAAISSARAVLALVDSALRTVQEFIAPYLKKQEDDKAAAAAAA